MDKRTRAEILFDIGDIDDDLKTLKDMMDFSDDKDSKKKNMDRINKTLDRRLTLMNERDGI